MEIKQGTIELLMDEEVGFKVDGNEIRLGDFYISKTNRQMLQSYDDRTGMSGYVNRSGFLYLWAGYRGPNDYKFVVNESGAYTMYNGTKYHIGECLAHLMGDDEPDDLDF